MKRIITLLALISTCFITFASPTDPTARKVVQPNGDTISISSHGDEYGSWYEDMNGNIIDLNSDKYWTYITIQNNKKVLTNQIVTSTPTPININKDSVLNFIMQKRTLLHIERNRTEFNNKNQESRALTGEYAPLPSIGQNKILTILVQFTDIQFQNSNEINSEITKMMNQTNYIHPGQSHITGSMRDYFLKASYNQLDISTTVLGPYTVSHDRAYYGANTESGDDIRPRELVQEAINLAINDIDVSQFDNNNDGWIECVHILYAGQGENIAGAPSECIWPHKWSLANAINSNGFSMKRYIVTPELSTINFYRGIGTICHELGHILGAPDFYDTNASVDGKFIGTGKWDLMGGGNWNGDLSAISPAHPNPYIKTELFGWSEVLEITGNNELYTLYPTESYNNNIYKLSTSTQGEYYLLENRQDLKLPGQGLIIYHINAGINNVANSQINIKHPQNLYVVDANNHITKPTESPTSYGNINSENATFRNSFSNNIYFTSTSKPSNCAWNGNQTINKNVCFISEEFIDGDSCIKFVLNPTIEGPEILCDSAIYSLKHVPSNATIEWSYINPSNFLTTTPLYIGLGQGTKNIWFKRGVVMSSSGTIPPIIQPWIPTTTSISDITTNPYSGFITINAKVIFNNDTFFLSKEIYMPEKVEINALTFVPANIWYTGVTKTITLKSPTDTRLMNDIRWDIELPGVSRYSKYGSSITITPITNGTIKITATYVNGCNNDDKSHTITYLAYKRQSLSFSNPASGNVEITVLNGDMEDSNKRTINNPEPYMGTYRLELWHDLYGKVRKIDVAENTPTVTMNLDGLSSGVYVLRLIIDNQIVVAEQMIVK
jgi:M6 family metalloprotease-like protein